MVISHGFTTQGRFDDTWAFSLKSNSWQDLNPRGSRPLKRCLQHAAIDETGGIMYLFGGCASGFGPCPLDDLWALDLTTNVWQEMGGSPRPAGRTHNGLAFDAARRRLVVYGGAGSAGLLNDYGEFDPATRNWSSPAISNMATARSRHQGVYAAGDIYFFGGSNLPDLLRLRTLGPRISSVRNAFSAAEGPVAPGGIVAVYGEDLGPATGVAASLSEGRLPTTLGSISVTVNGLAAPLFYSQSGQINLQIPYEVQGTTATLQVRSGNTLMASTTLPLAPTAPGLFTGAFGPTFIPNSNDAPASPGSVIVLFATGHGQTMPPAKDRPGRGFLALHPTCRHGSAQCGQCRSGSALRRAPPRSRGRDANQRPTARRRGKRKCRAGDIECRRHGIFQSSNCDSLAYAPTFGRQLFAPWIASFTAAMFFTP